jgi:hypothetical protein
VGGAPVGGNRVQRHVRRPVQLLARHVVLPAGRRRPVRGVQLLHLHHRHLLDGGRGERLLAEHERPPGRTRHRGPVVRDAGHLRRRADRDRVDLRPPVAVADVQDRRRAGGSHRRILQPVGADVQHLDLTRHAGNELLPHRVRLQRERVARSHRFPAGDRLPDRVRRVGAHGERVGRAGRHPHLRGVVANEHDRNGPREGARVRVRRWRGG